MNITLAIETTERYGSVALLDGSAVLSAVSLPHDRRSAQTLAPAMDEILRTNGVKPQDVTSVAVVTGPGSFTGLRVGVSTAKMFAYAVGAAVTALNTFEVIAQAVAEKPEPPRFLTVGVDAQRGEIAVQSFEYRSEYVFINDPQLLSLADWLKQAEKAPSLCYTGPALERYHGKMPDVRLAPQEFWFPQAVAAGKLSRQKQATDTPFSLVPVYSRLSAAEEKSFNL